MISRIFWISFLAGFHYLSQLWKGISRNKIFFLLGSQSGFWRRTGSGGLIQLKLYITGHRAVATRQAKKADCVSSGCRPRQTEMNGFDSLPEDYVCLIVYVCNGKHRELWCWVAEEALTPSEILGVRKEKRKRSFIQLTYLKKSYIVDCTVEVFIYLLWGRATTYIY